MINNILKVKHLFLYLDCRYITSLNGLLYIPISDTIAFMTFL